MPDIFDNVTFIVPARRGSKGVKHKNRLLLDYTLRTIPKDLVSKLVVSTNDEWISDYLDQSEITVIQRPETLSGDDVDVKQVMAHAIKSLKIVEHRDVVMLYLVWPDRTFEQIEQAYRVYLEEGVDSLLCATPVESHPYMTFYWKKKNLGKPVVDHNYYRRQDYPACFVINHLVTIFKAREIENLNSQLYNESTYFHPVEKLLNIDEEDDLKQLLNRDILN